MGRGPGVGKERERETMHVLILYSLPITSEVFVEYPFHVD